MALIDRDWAENSLSSRNINTFSILLLLGISLFHRRPVKSEEWREMGNEKSEFDLFNKSQHTTNFLLETKQGKNLVFQQNIWGTKIREMKQTSLKNGIIKIDFWADRILLNLS